MVVVFVVVTAEVSMSDTDTWLVLSCAGCGNRAREGEAIMWIVVNEADDRASTEAGLVVQIATNRSLDANECKNLGIVRDWMT